jgi:lipopolysaccharide/colanic/teichoic acid biosynthesis glycosyltransferase
MVNISRIIGSPKGPTKGGSLLTYDKRPIETPYQAPEPGRLATSSPGIHTLSSGTSHNFFDPTGRTSLETMRMQKPISWWKHFLDLFCIAISLPVWLPVMLIISAWIKVMTGGPVIFRQTRVGRNEEPFTLFKFRTMKVDAQHQAHHKYFRTVVKGGLPMTKMDSYHDKRLIPGGWFLRTTGLDELPQLLNVLQRKMSLVGPRPCLPEEMTWYDEAQRARFKCLPGITGYWQVNGKNSTTFDKMVELDIRYVDRMSLALDTFIILVTIPALMAHALESRRERTRLRNVPLPLRPDTVRIE